LREVSDSRFDVSREPACHDGEDFRSRLLIERKERLCTFLADSAPCLHYSDHVIGQERRLIV
jgi:hypothetical protein